MPDKKTFRECLNPEQLKKLDRGDDSVFESLTPEQQERLEELFEEAMTPGQRESLERLTRCEPVDGFPVDLDELKDRKDS